MRIAQVSPLYESVPPKLYGGTERVIAYLTDELVRAGHDVTLFASGDSRTRARLVASCPRGLRLDPSLRDPVSYHVAQVSEVFARAEDFDVLHFHTEPYHYPLVARSSRPTVTTLHGRLDLPGLSRLRDRFPDLPVISISDDQRSPLPDLAWRATIYHGLPRDLLRPGDGGGGYLAFLGRISPEKGPATAIEIARRAGLPLRVAAKVDDIDRGYFETVIAPLVERGGVELVGEIGEDGKQAFLGDARALLFPIDWPEPFGLVMIEAMACGTPIVAFRCGSVPEVMTDGVTGFVVDDIEEAVAAVERLDDLDRREVRAVFERRFTAERMAADHLELYDALIGDVRLPGHGASLVGAPTMTSSSRLGRA